MDYEKVMQRADALVRQFAARDDAAAKVRMVRRGEFEALAPGSFNEDYPAPIIANRIDTMARDVTAVLSPLPTISCSPTNSLQDKAKAFAEKRSKIAQFYIESSNLQAQQPDAVDSLNCYGMLAYQVEPDWKNKTPKIRQVDGSCVYPVWDKDLRTVEVAHVTYVSLFTLQAHFPERAARLMREHPNCDTNRIKIVRYENADCLLAYLPELDDQPLVYAPNRLGRCSYVCVPRPSGMGTWAAVPRGAYDDLIWPLLAANDFRMLALEGTAKSVQAPLAVPMDVTDVSYGPDAVLHSATPQLIQRVGADIPNAAFTVGEVLDRDMQVGGMSPGSRAGTLDASVITGRGVDALGEGYSEQIALMRGRIAWGLEQAIACCFEMDEKFWPNDEKKIRGAGSQVPFGLTYIPSRDISGDYTVQADYGFILGLDPNRALVFILQSQAAGLMSKDTATRNLPVKLDLVQEESKIQLEQVRNSLIQAMAAAAQAIGPMVAQGQDPAALIASFAQIAEGLKKGQPIETVTAKVFAPQPPPPAPALAGPAAPPGVAAPGGSEPGGGLNPAIATEGPNARPDLQQMFAGLTAGGNPNLGSVVSRMAPVVGN